MDFGWSVDELPPYIVLPLQKEYNCVRSVDINIPDIKIDTRRFKRMFNYSVAMPHYVAFYHEEI